MCVCVCGRVFVWPCICVCVSREFMPTLCLVASRDGAGLASCWGTQEAELEENMTYIAIREKRILSFHNAHRSALHTDVYSIQMHNMFSFCSDIISWIPRLFILTYTVEPYRIFFFLHSCCFNLFDKYYQLVGLVIHYNDLISYILPTIQSKRI